MAMVRGSVTLEVATVKVVEVCPAAIGTEAGTVASVASLDCRFTVAPPDGAAFVSAIDPVTGLPPVVEGEASASVSGGFTASIALALEVPYMAVIVTDCCAVTVDVVMLNDAEVCPNVIVRLAGT